MKRFSALLLVGALGVSACASPDRFGNGSNQPNSGPVQPVQPADPLQNVNSPQYFSQIIGDRVLFVVDSSELTATGRATLDSQASWLGRNGDYLAVIEGHADEQGTREYNLALGARRANAVREYLLSKGVSSARIRTVSYGKERPLEVCSEESCYAKNRRAVTIISAGSLS